MLFFACTNKRAANQRHHDDFFRHSPKQTALRREIHIFPQIKKEPNLKFFIPLTPKLKDILSIQYQHQQNTRLLAGNNWHSHGLVFSTDIGTPYEGRRLTRVLHQVLKQAGLDQLGVHALRHTFATRALESGMDIRTLSELMGHANISLTLQLYAHSTAETKQNVLHCMEKYL